MTRVVGTAALLVMSTAGVVRARDASVADWLQWTASPGADACLGAELFASRVERSLGRSAAVAASDAHVTVAARIERLALSAPRTTPRWWGEIRVRGNDGVWHGSRSLSRDGASCQPLADALALATALVLSTDAADGPTPPRLSPGAAAPSEPGPAPDPTSEPTSQPMSAPAAERPPVRPVAEPPRPEATPVEYARAQEEPRAAASRSWQVGADGGIAFGIGVLPEPSLGATASVFVQLGGGTKIFAGARAWSQQTSAVGAGQGATLSLASLGLGGCPLNGGRHAWTWRTCARGDVGRLRALGFGFTRSTSQERLTADAAAAVELRRRLVGPLFAEASVELVVPLIRDRIAYSGSSGEVVTIFRPGPVAGAGALRLGCVF